MKKLLIAVSAAACALGAFADEFTQSGTSFENLPEGTFSTAVDDNNDPIASSALGQFWYTAAEADGIEATVKTFGAEGASAAHGKTRPEQFTGDNTKYLNIESTSEPLYRTVEANDGTGVGTGQTGVYIDTMVQFTAGDPTMSADDDQAKLAIWVCGNTEDGDPATETNFVVRAGQFTADGFAKTNYTMTAAGVTFTPGEWYRLTVKTIENVGVVNGLNYAGYVVFVDGEMLVPASGAPAPGVTAYTGDYAAGVLPSMVNDDTTIAAVGFSGTGAIDDISFTTTAPDFAADAQNYLVDIGDGVTLKFDDTTLIDGNGYAAGADLTFTATAASGFLVWYTNDVEVARNAGTWTGTLVKDDVLKVVALTQNCLVGNVPYESLADAFANAASGSTIKLTGAVTLAEATMVNVEEGKTFTLDLNGQTLTGGDVAVIVNAGTLTIVDTSADQTGRVVPKTAADGEEVYAITTSGALTINAGTYDGAVLADGGTIALTGGKFKNVFEDDLESWKTSYGYELGDLTVALVDGYFVVGAETEPTVITITFNVDGVETTKTTDAEGKVTAPADPTKTGYTFTGWFADGADTATDLATTVFEADTKLTAQWTANKYTVTFYTNGVEYASVQYTYAGTDYEAPADPVIDGFTFDGWFADDGTFETAFEFSANVADDQDAYAKLTAVPAGPTVGGVTVDAETAFDKANSQNGIVFPAGSTVAVDGGNITVGGVVFAAVPEYYNATVEGTTVKLELNQNAIPEIGEATVDEVSKPAIEVGDDDFKLTVKGTKTGWFYRLIWADTPNAKTWTPETNWVNGDGANKQLPAAKGANGRFYKIQVKDHQ